MDNEELIEYESTLDTMIAEFGQEGFDVTKLEEGLADLQKQMEDKGIAGKWLGEHWGNA